MIRMASKLSRASSTAFDTLTSKPSPILCTRVSPLPAFFRSIYFGSELDKRSTNPDVIDMIRYALRHARTEKSIGSYGLGTMVLKHCLTMDLTEGHEPKNENSRGITLLAYSSLLSERGEYADAIETLQSVQELTNSYLGVRVAALEAQAGLHLELGQDDMASALADKCIELVEKQGTKDVEILTIRAKALKGLVELVNGDINSAEAFFDKSLCDRNSDGTAALTYGEFLHAKQNYSMAREVYWNVMQGATDIKNSGNPYLGAGYMDLDGLMLGAMCALGQLESRVGKFGHAEDWLRKALNKAEETYGTNHPKVGVVLTSIALLYRRKAIEEHSSSLLVQEGLYRKVLNLLKVPPVETESEGTAPLVDGREVAALATGAYAEVLSVQENRKGEGDKLKKLAESLWRNRRMSLADALENTEANIAMVIDSRFSRLV